MCFSACFRLTDIAQQLTSVRGGMLKAEQVDTLIQALADVRKEIWGVDNGEVISTDCLEVVVFILLLFLGRNPHPHFPPPPLPHTN